MVYPGIGWVIYRDESCLPDDMVRVVNIWIVSVDSAPHDGVLFLLNYTFKVVRSASVQVLTTSYLGKPEPTMTINFSRNAAQVAASYYNVCRP